MLVVTLPTNQVTGAGVLRDTALDMNTKGFESLDSNSSGMTIFTQKRGFKALSVQQAERADVDEIAKVQGVSIGELTYINLLSGTPNLLQTVVSMGGDVQGIMFYAKAPVAKLNDNVPATYPNATYTDENGVTQSYTYDTYKWSTGDSLPFTVGDYIYFAVSLYGGQGPAKGSEALILASDGVEIISRDAYIAAMPTVEE